ncbi:MAG: iron-containing alcohol dehydrogenase [Clostridia bacterium]|nr:iron-containing alcohol dehydrogenase [Clostridia bacterium]
MNFNMFMPANVFGGENALSRAAEKICSLGKKALIITGKSAAKKSGALDDVTSMLTDNGVSFVIFDGVSENPLVSVCDEAGKTAGNEGCDFIIAIGGGSAMDAGKAASVFAANDINGNDIYDYSKWTNGALPLVAVGTTSGTGSEVTATAVLTRTDPFMKKSVTNPLCYPKISVCDSKYTYSMPMNVTVSTALDALSHATEGWFNPSCGDFESACARVALPMIWKGLSALNKTESGDEISDKTRDRLYYGSLWAGLVLNGCGTAFPHPLGYVLSEEFGVPHGMACAVYLPELVRRGMEQSPDRANEYFDLLGCKWAQFNLVVTTLTDVSVQLTEEQLQRYAKRWHGLKNFRNTPGGYNEQLAVALLRRLFM